MKNCTKFLLKSSIAGLLGVLLTVAFAPYQVFPLAVVTIVGLLFLIYPASLRLASWLGYCFGLGLFGAGVYWVFIAIHDFSESPLILAILSTVLFIMLLAVFPMAACYLTKRYFGDRSSTIQLVLAFPTFWVILEWLRSILFTGFPWLFIGYSQTNSPLKGYAPLLSVYVVSLMAIISSGLIIDAYLHYRSQTYKKVYRNLFWCAGIWIMGALLSLIPWTTPYGKPIEVSLVQGDIPQSLKWSPDNVYLSYDRYAELTKSTWGKGKLIIWPEAALPVTLQDAESFLRDMDEKAWNTGSHLILGIPMVNEAGDGYYNAIITVGATRQVYTKRRLVPYGEYVPFKKISARIFDFMHIPMADMVPGNPRQEPFIIDGVKILPSICYEVTYPELMNPRNPDINLLLTVTNDAWYGESNAQAQHLQMAAMRAIELARPLLFVSNDGITAIIGPTGNIEEAAPPHEPYVLTGKVQPMTGYTPWIKNGIDPLLAILFGLLYIAYRSQRVATNTNENIYERTVSATRS